MGIKEKFKNKKKKKRCVVHRSISSFSGMVKNHVVFGTLNVGSLCYTEVKCVSKRLIFI